MPWPVLSDRESVVSLAKQHFASRPGLTQVGAARLALREHFCLGPDDDIPGGGDVADRMGHIDREADDKLLDDIAGDVAMRLPVTND